MAGMWRARQQKSGQLEKCDFIMLLRKILPERGNFRQVLPSRGIACAFEMAKCRQGALIRQQP